MRITNLPIGAEVQVYAHAGSVQIAYNEMFVKLKTTIVATHHPNGIQFPDPPTRYLLGWEEDKPGEDPNTARPRQNLDYNYSKANGYDRGMFHMFNIREYAQWENVATRGIYHIHPELNRFVWGKWIAWGSEIHRVEDTHFGSGPIISPVTGGAKFINASEVRPGDTIAWYDSDHQINYAHVVGVEEGEDITENPIVVLDGSVFCKDGLRSYPKGYPLPQTSNILLLNRI